jgi:hypothetical protein
MVWPCLTFLNLCVGRAMPGLTLYVFACMLHCNGLAMPDLLKLGVGRAMPGFTLYVFVYAPSTASSGVHTYPFTISLLAAHWFEIYTSFDHGCRYLP